MAQTKPELETFYARNRQEWRDWLAAHYADTPGVWLLYYKKDSGKPRVAYAEAVEEALCFGWIDSKPNTLDDERYMQLFTPRKPKSPWAKSNKERVVRLIAEGLMTPAGLEKIEAAKQNGMWEQYDSIEEVSVPPDLEAALAANPTAQANFQAFSSSSVKVILWWIHSARRPETRAKRIEETVRLAAQNLKANQYRQ